MPSPSSAVIVREEAAHAVIQAPALQEAMAAMLPTPAARERFMRVIAQAFTREPKLAKCTQTSVVNAVVDALTWGLEPSGRVGGAYLVPFHNSRDDVDEATLIPDYRGLIDVITRPGSRVTAITVTDVREGDAFEYTEGLTPSITHVPSLAPNRSAKPTTHAYAVALLDTGERVGKVIDRAYAEKIAAKAKSSRSPWQTDFDAMFRKTAVKALANTLPVSREIRGLMARDDIIDGEAREVAALPAPASQGQTRMARLGERMRGERTTTSGSAAGDGPSAAGQAPAAGSPSPAAGATTDDDTVEGEARELERPRVDPRSPEPQTGDPCPLHPGSRLAGGGDKGVADLYHSLGRGQGYCRPYQEARRG